jgi:CDP-diacylglycerol--glycerol-3-phosphate 3-phosphatidyltransferase
MLAAVLVVVAAWADTVDGALAIITRRATRFGYVYDALADRLGEVGWIVAFVALGANPWMVGLCGALMWLHEYVRASAAAAGTQDPGPLGLGEQSTRVPIVVGALFFAGAGGLVSPALAVGTVTVAGAIWAMVQAIGFLQLLAVAHRALR